MSKEEIIQELEDAIEAIIDDVVESDGWYMTGAGTAAEKITEYIMSKYTLTKIKQQ